MRKETAGKLVIFGNKSLPTDFCQVQMHPMKSGLPRFLHAVISGNLAITTIMVFTAGLSAANGSHPIEAPPNTEGKGVIQMGAFSTA